MVTDVKKMKTDLSTEATAASKAAEKIVRDAQSALLKVTEPYEGNDVTFVAMSLAFQAQQHLTMLVNQMDNAARMAQPAPMMAPPPPAMPPIIA